MKTLFVIGCIALFACTDFIPDQDAVISIDATKDSLHQYIQYDCNKVYDTNLSTLSLKLVLLNNSETGNKEVFLYQKNTIPKKGKTTNGAFDFGWIQGGTYSIQVGNTSTYPCLNISNIIIPNGHGCELQVKLPTKHSH